MKTKKSEVDPHGAVASRVLKHFGVPNVLKIVNQELHGSSLMDLVDLFTRLGFKVLSGEMDISCLRHVTDQSWPAVAQLDDRLVLVTGVERERVKFFDPVEGETEDPVSAFLARWGSQSAVVVWQE